MTESARPAPRTVVVTGASAGLGAALARIYAAPGVTLGLIARDRERLARIAADCRASGAVVHEAAIDVRDARALATWLAAFDDTAAVDLVIANAGVATGPCSDAEPEGDEAASRQIETNLLGVIHTVEPLLPRMIARGRGHVAMLGSIAAYRGLPDHPAYCASKAGVRLYGESLRPLVAPGGVAVSVILPGFFESAMSAAFQGPRPLMISAERAAAIVRRGLDRRRRRIVFPRRLGLVLQALDLLPAFLGDWLIRRSRFRIGPRA